MHRNLCIVSLICWANLLIPTASLGAEPQSPLPPGKTMNLCVVENNPPFAFRNDQQELIGFNVDMWNAMNIPYAFNYRHPDFPTALAAIAGGYCQMLLSNISVTPERLQRFVLSDPYLRSSLAVMVRGSEVNIKTIADLQDKTISVLKGSTSEEVAMQYLKGGELLALNTERDMYTALLDGDVDAVLGDLPLMQHFINGEGRGFARILPMPVSPQLYAYGFGKGVDPVRDSVNAAIKRLQHDGTVAHLYQKWFGTSLATTPLSE